MDPKWTQNGPTRWHTYKRGSPLTSTGTQNSKNGVANPNSLLSKRHRSHRLRKPALTPEHHTIIIHAAESTLVVVPMADLIFISLVNLAQAPMAIASPTACMNRRSIHYKRANTPHRKRGSWSKNDNTSAQHKHLAYTVMLCRHSASTCNNILLDGASSETEPCPKQCTHHQWKHGGRIPARSHTGMPESKKKKQYRDHAVMCLPSRQSSEQEYCSLTAKGNWKRWLVTNVSDIKPEMPDSIDNSSSIRKTTSDPKSSSHWRKCAYFSSMFAWNPNLGKR